PRNTGFDAMEQGGLVLELFCLLWKNGARANKTEVSLDDINQLGEFIERGLTEEVAKTCDTWVILYLAVYFIFACQIFSPHRTEFFSGVFFTVFRTHTPQLD